MMDFIISRIPHIEQRIFEQLDVKSLKNCRGVAKLWQKSIAPLFKYGYNPSLIDGILNVFPYELA